MRPQLIPLLETAVMTEIPSVIGNQKGLITSIFKKDLNSNIKKLNDSSSSSDDQKPTNLDQIQIDQPEYIDVDRTLDGLLDSQGMDIYGYFPRVDPYKNIELGERGNRGKGKNEDDGLLDDGRPDMSKKNFKIGTYILYDA
jgi:hypothetical protein